MRFSSWRAHAGAAVAGVLVAAGAGLALRIAPAAAAGSNNLDVKASEYVFKMSGKPVAGNVQVTFTNVGTELHMFALSEVNPGVTAEQVEAAAASSQGQ